MYVKMKELGPIGGGVHPARHPPQIRQWGVMMMFCACETVALKSKNCVDFQYDSYEEQQAANNSLTMACKGTCQAHAGRVT